MKKRIISTLKSCPPYAASFVFILIAVAALSVTSVNAQCQQWLVTGDWAMEQTDRAQVSMHTQQNGTAITGTASYLYTQERNGHLYPNGVMNGTVTGNIVGNDFYVEITFADGGVGIYRATINAQGRIEGIGYPRYQASTKSNFFSTQVMKCQPRIVNSGAPKPPATTPPPHHEGKLATFGKPKTPASNPAPTPPVNVPPPTPRKLPAAPYILASDVKVSLGKISGQTTLSWDAGADHPYAEVWVKINGGAEKKVVEKGKGSMGADIKLGTQYTYILTDDGVTMATVNVTAHN